MSNRSEIWLSSELAVTVIFLSSSTPVVTASIIIIRRLSLFVRLYAECHGYSNSIEKLSLTAFADNCTVIVG